MEKWKDIPDYEGIYEASTLGRIRSKPGKTTFSKRHGTRHWQTRVLKQKGNREYGKRVTLWKDGKPKDLLVARIVAMTWVDGYQECLTVNHIDGDRLNNNVENLEWVTLADNIRHGFETGLYTSVVPIKLKHIHTGDVYEFKSLAEASRFLGKNNGYVSGKLKKGRDIPSFSVI